MVAALCLGEVSAHAERSTYKLADGSSVSFECVGPQVDQSKQPAKARFAAMASQIEFDPTQLSATRGKLTVQLASVTTEDAAWDEMFRKAPFLDVEKLPLARFEITRLAGEMPMVGAWTDVSVEGKLSLHGVTKPIQTKGRLWYEPTKLKLETVTQIKWEDYKIAVPDGRTRTFAGDGAKLDIRLNYIPGKVGGQHPKKSTPRPVKAP